MLNIPLLINVRHLRSESRVLVVVLSLLSCVVCGWLFVLVCFEGEVQSLCVRYGDIVKGKLGRTKRFGMIWGQTDAAMNLT